MCGEAHSLYVLLMVKFVILALLSEKKTPNFKGVDQRVVTNYSVSIKRAITGVHAFKGIKNNSTVSCTSAF